MCTLVLLPLKGAAFLLGMNRDESVNRSRSSFPPLETAQKNVLYPIDSSAGGTWLGVHSSGVALALLNNYSKDVPVLQDPTPEFHSRGSIIVDLLKSEQQKKHEIQDYLNSNLKSLRPFRLFLISSKDQLLVEFVSDFFTLETIQHPWEKSVFVSSSLREAEATTLRKQQFDSFFTDKLPSVSSIKDFLCTAPFTQESLLHGNIFIKRPGVHTESSSVIEFLNREQMLEFHYRQDLEWVTQKL